MPKPKASKSKTKRAPNVKRSNTEQPKKYVVQEILNSRKRKGKTEYFIKWRNYSADHNSWEPAKNCGECKDLIDQYKAKKRASIENRRRPRNPVELFVEQPNPPPPENEADVIINNEIVWHDLPGGIRYDPAPLAPPRAPIAHRAAPRVIPVITLDDDEPHFVHSNDSSLASEEDAARPLTPAPLRVFVPPRIPNIRNGRDVQANPQPGPSRQYAISSSVDPATLDPDYQKYAISKGHQIRKILEVNKVGSSGVSALVEYESGDRETIPTRILNLLCPEPLLRFFEMKVKGMRP